MGSQLICSWPPLEVICPRLQTPSGSCFSARYTHILPLYIIPVFWLRRRIPASLLTCHRNHIRYTYHACFRCNLQLRVASIRNLLLQARTIVVLLLRHSENLDLDRPGLFHTSFCVEVFHRFYALYSVTADTACYANPFNIGLIRPNICTV